MEPKYFFEVFSELKIRDELKKIYDDVLVRRVVNNRNKNLIRIYIESGRLIHKKDIYEMESVIKKMFNNAVSIRIIEHFTLSSQYNSENLYKMYEDSILTEIREYSKVEYSLLKKAEIAFILKLSIGFTVKEPSKVNEALLKSAAENAKKKAEILCAASGAKLGELINIDYNWGELNIYSRTNYDMEMDCLKTCAATPYSLDIEPDDIDAADTVTFVWQIA